VFDHLRRGLGRAQLVAAFTAVALVEAAGRKRGGENGGSSPQYSLPSTAAGGELVEPEEQAHEQARPRLLQADDEHDRRRSAWGHTLICTGGGGRRPLEPVSELGQELPAIDSNTARSRAHLAAPAVDPRRIWRLRRLCVQSHPASGRAGQLPLPRGDVAIELASRSSDRRWESSITASRSSSMYSHTRRSTGSVSVTGSS
jgi:hypothetical protein